MDYSLVCGVDSENDKIVVGIVGKSIVFGFEFHK
jgi:hypothetical protein